MTLSDVKALPCVVALDVVPGSGDMAWSRRAAVIREPAAFTILGLTKDQDHQKAAGIVFQDTASVLFGVEGLQVTDVQAGPDGTLEVWAVTDYPAAAACPDCGTVSARRHDTVLARPRDVRRAGDPVAVWWVKCRWKCDGRRAARGRRSPSGCRRCRRGAG